MKKYLIGFLSGGTIACGLLIPLHLEHSENKYEHGKNVGYSNAQSDMFKFLETHFSDSNDSGEHKNYMHWKDRSIQIKTKNGVKTIEVK